MDKVINKEIFYYEALRTIVGALAIAVAFVCTLTFYNFTELPWSLSTIPTSISVTFHLGSVIPFVGILFIVSAFLFVFHGTSTAQLILTKFAGLFALMVACFPTAINGEWIKQLAQLNPNIPKELPTKCINLWADDPSALCNIYSVEYAPKLHYTGAIGLIGILCILCFIFAHRTVKKAEMFPEFKKPLLRRRLIYIVCGSSMIASFVARCVFADIDAPGDKSIFWVELVCLIAFGISWLVAGIKFKMTGLSNGYIVEHKMSEEIDNKLPSNIESKS